MGYKRGSGRGWRGRDPWQQPAAGILQLSQELNAGAAAREGGEAEVVTAGDEGRVRAAGSALRAEGRRARCSASTCLQLPADVCGRPQACVW